MPDIFQRLAAPLPPNKVSWRVGQVTKKDPKKASALCYIDARDVMERLDEVLTPAGWSDSYCETVKGRLICTISVKVGDQWISKSDGAGDTAVEGEKGAISDSFKRCAVKWGVGRYLYDIPIQWVAINDFKQIEPSEKTKLERALPGSRVADDDSHTDAPPRQEAAPRPATGAQKPPETTDPHVEHIKLLAKSLKASIGKARNLDELNIVRADPDFDEVEKANPITFNFLVGCYSARQHIIEERVHA